MKNEILNGLKDSVAALENVLASFRNGLDGCQYLIELDMPAEGGFENYPAVLGEWPKAIGSPAVVRGFRSSDLVRHDLCGCILKSLEAGSLAVRYLHSLGYRSARLVHREAFLNARLVKARALLAGLEKGE